MYDYNSILIVTILFALILIAYEVCFRIGRHYQQKTDKDLKVQTNSIQAGMLGLLALLLGFTFNMSLQRYNDRSHAVITEANSIGTAMLRTKLLPKPYDSVSYNLLQEYISLRLKVNYIDLTKYEAREAINKNTDEIENKLWESAVKAASIDSRPVTSGNYITSLNELIDARGERNALLQRHVPEPILFLLFIIFIISGALMGYSSGLAQRRVYIPTIIFTLLIVLVVFIIIDLDRPKRGIIKVDQERMIELILSK